MGTLSWMLLADGPNQVELVARQFGVSWPHLISQIISFCIVCFFLQRFAYGPVLKMLAKRREEIASGLAMVEENRKQLANANAERQRILDDANSQAEQILKDARVAAGQVREQKVQAAVEEANQIRAKAREQIQLERNDMMRELQGQVGQLVVKTTAAVAGRVLTREDQVRLLSETAQTLDA